MLRNAGVSSGNLALKKKKSTTSGRFRVTVGSRCRERVKQNTVSNKKCERSLSELVLQFRPRREVTPVTRMETYKRERDGSSHFILFEKTSCQTEELGFLLLKHYGSNLFLPLG